MAFLAALPALVGLTQTIIGGVKAKKAREEVEKIQPPKASPDASVSRYYNEALRRYNTAPTSTAMYKNAMFNAQRNQAAGLNALKDRRSLIGGVSSIVGRTNDASIRAAAQAEADQNQKFGQLGGATANKTADTRFLFGQNQMAPYQKALTLAGMKGQANAQTMNTGISNIYSGLSNYAIMKNAYDMNNTEPGWKRGWSQLRADNVVAKSPGLSNPALAYGTINYNDPDGAPPQ